MKRRGFLKGVFAVPFAGKAIAETKGTSKSVSEYRGYFVDLSKEQTLDVLKQSELIWYLDQGGPFGPWPKVDIVYDDKRWGIGFTTLADNVGVDISIPIPE